MQQCVFSFLLSFSLRLRHFYRAQAQSWIRWFVQCSNCLCLCDDIKSKRSERYFSLRAVVSNIADNKYAYNDNHISYLHRGLSLPIARKLNLISNEHFPLTIIIIIIIKSSH